MMPGSSWSKAGLAGLVVLISIVIIGLIVYFGPGFGIETYPVQAMIFAAVWVVLLVIRYTPVMLRFMREKYHRWTEQKSKAIPGDESRLEQTATRAVTLVAIREAMRHLYGRFWQQKIRILLITGSPDDVESLLPGLTTQLWQEDKATLLLWGGDLNAQADDPWLAALRTLRRRPADGMVWVTQAFDRLAAPGLSLPQAVPSESTMDRIALAISSKMDALGWRLPLYVWSLHPRAGEPQGRLSQATGCLLAGEKHGDELTARLQALSSALLAPGIEQMCDSTRHRFLLTLADQLIREPGSVAEPLSVLRNPYRPLPLAGVVFSQVTAGSERSGQHRWGMDKRWEILPLSVRALPSGLRPRRPGVSCRRAMAPATAVLMGLCAGWIALSFINNRSMIAESQGQAALALAQQQSLAERLQALAALQKTLARLQYRSEHGVPWYERAGLSQNSAQLNALWPHYRASAQPLLRDAAAGHLLSRLNAFTALPPGSPLREQRAKAAYDQLKLYLMLTRPEHMHAAWFSTTLAAQWPQRENVKNSLWQGMAPSLLSFYGAALAAHPGWRLPADESKVGQTRSLLINLMGMRNSESTLYQKMLAQVAHLYRDMQLSDMTGDTDAARLFSTTEVVPGMFTRQAWEQAVQPAIARVVKERREEMDWVLTDNQQQPQQEVSPEALQQRLTGRYFADFGGAWLGFLNSLRWNRTATLSDSIDQLILMADVRQSPLVALMNTLNVQGRTGQTGGAIADSLVKSAKNLLGRDSPDAIDQSADVQGPLDATFGPVLALLDKNRAGTQSQSLQSYLTRVTQVRLRLQQVTNAADPQAMTRTLAQTVFQGNAVDLTETRDYGSLVAAGLGQEWSGFGRMVFVLPMEQAWQQVLTPAADSLNAQWRQAVVSEWNSAFGGRYPFSNASSDVSLPLLAKYLNADAGRIAQFLQTRLNGVLHREGSHWIPDSINAQGLTFNPAFLQAMNTLSHISDVAFTQGNAGMNFELRPGTSAGVMQTGMIIDSQKLTYVNQMPQWKRFTWPADTEAPGASLSWISSQAGTRQYADMPGAWGWIRLLDSASVSAYPGVNSSYSLSWKAQDGRALNYTLRTEAGEGPLVLLKLRNFRLPENIFSVNTSPSRTDIDDADTQEID